MIWPRLEPRRDRPCGCITDPVVFGHVCSWPGTYAVPVRR